MGGGNWQEADIGYDEKAFVFTYEMKQLKNTVTQMGYKDRVPLFPFTERDK